jgi:hypothetical protein
MTDKLISTAVNFDETADDLIIEKSQYIPQWHLDQLKADRAESASSKAGEYHRVASVPVAVHELWLSQGYDCLKEPVKKTLAKLKAENLDYFITSDKV